MKAYKGDRLKVMAQLELKVKVLQDENLIPGKSLDYYKDIM